MLRLHNKAALCLVASMLLLGALVPGSALAQDARQAALSYRSLITRDQVQWDFTISDSWFEKDADAYSHPIAQLSLGLAISAFRVSPGAADANVLDFMTRLGFTDLVSEDYDLVPTIDTISTVIGQRTLPSGDTLVAVAICGQGYENEWLSNLDIGAQEEHKGFSASAARVEKRVEAYLQTRGITNARLWMCGFSRAAAVANLTSAHLMEKGLFNQKNAFVYTFATPRTTRTPVAHPNLYNIVGKFDPVTKTPFQEWGYERHGVTLFTPAQETDSDYRARQAAADIPFYALTGMHLWNSPVINQHLAIIEAYLLSNVPSAANYHTKMSALIAQAWNQPGPDAIVTVLRAMAEITEEAHPGEEEYLHWTEELLDYMVSALLGTTTHDIDDPGIANLSTVSAGVTLLLEHNPDVYLAWMFSSDDPDQIFTDKTKYIQLVISGDADVNLFDQKGGFIFSVSPKGEVLDVTGNEHYNRRIRPPEDRPLLTAMTVQKRRMIVVPNDQGFPFTMVARSDSDLSYYALYYDIRQCSPAMSTVRHLHMERDQEYLAFSLTPRGQSIMKSDEPLWGDSHETGRIFDPDHLLTADDINQIASLNPYSVSVRTAMRILFCLAATVALLPLLIIWRHIRRRRKKARLARENETAA